MVETVAGAGVKLEGQKRTLRDGDQPVLWDVDAHFPAGALS